MFNKFGSLVNIIKIVKELFATIGLTVNTDKCDTNDNGKRHIEFLNVQMQRTYEEKQTIAHRLHVKALELSYKVTQMIQAGIPNHIIFKFIQYCIIPKLNWGAFIDEDRFNNKQIYEQIDDIVITMVHNVCIPHVIDCEEFAVNFSDMR